MCDISKLTKYKTKTVYKVVIRLNSCYASVYSHLILHIGKVDKMIFNGDSVAKKYPQGSNFYNPIMIGKVSGFSSLYDAKWLDYGNCVTGKNIILKIKLGGIIYQGTGKNMLFYHENDPYNIVTYAGTEILSMEEVK